MMSAAITFFSLFLYILTISFTHGIEESKELYEQIATINKEISPYAQLAVTLSIILATGPALDENLSSLGFDGIDPGRITIYELLLQIFRSLLGQQTDNDEAVQEAVRELIKYLALNGDNTVNNLKPFKYEPFIPATDSDGNLLCLTNTAINDICLEDPSYPKWYTILIGPSVATVFGEKQASDELICKTPPREEQRCKEVPVLGLIATAKFQGNSSEEYRFLLQTMGAETVFKGSKCETTTQTCTVPSRPGEPFKCDTVSDGPVYTPGGRRSTKFSKYLVINSTGLLEVADLVSIDYPCWCKCMSD